jgi:hypothetical protein
MDLDIASNIDALLSSCANTRAREVQGSDHHIELLHYSCHYSACLASCLCHVLSVYCCAREFVVTTIVLAGCEEVD